MAAGVTGFRFRWHLFRAAFSRHPWRHGCSWQFLAYSNMRYADALVAKMEQDSE